MKKKEKDIYALSPMDRAQLCILKVRRAGIDRLIAQQPIELQRFDLRLNSIRRTLEVKIAQYESKV